MDKKTLFIRDPQISTYTSYGCLFSIMDETLWPWVYNNFIQIRYAHSWKIFAFDNHHILLKNCPAISFYDIPQELAIKKWGTSLKDIIIEAVDMDHYLYIYVDRFYIEKSLSYGKEHFYHELFIYGYDLSKNMVLVADNLTNGRFIRAEIPFLQIEQGYWNLPDEHDFFTEIRFLKKKNIETRINPQQIVNNLENYLYSKPTYDLIEEQPFDFGLKALDRLTEYISRVQQSGKGMDIRGFQLIQDHKTLMSKRLRFLVSEGYLKPDDRLLEMDQILLQEYSALRNLVLKYNIKTDTKILKDIQSKLEENIINDQLFVSVFIEKLKENNYDELWSLQKNVSV